MFAFWVVWPPLHVSHCSSLKDCRRGGELAGVARRETPMESAVLIMGFLAVLSFDRYNYEARQQYYMYIYIYIYNIYIYIYIYISLSLYIYIYIAISLSLYIYIHMCLYLYIDLSLYLYMCIYIYIYTQRTALHTYYIVVLVTGPHCFFLLLIILSVCLSICLWLNTDVSAFLSVCG